MANARRCDKCKGFFDPLNPDTGMLDHPNEMVRFRNPIFQTPDSVKIGTVNGYLLNESPDCMVDLCPICTKKFRDFMNNKEEE